MSNPLKTCAAPTALGIFLCRALQKAAMRAQTLNSAAAEFKVLP